MSEELSGENDKIACVRTSRSRLSGENDKMHASELQIKNLSKPQEKVGSSTIARWLFIFVTTKVSTVEPLHSNIWNSPVRYDVGRGPRRRWKIDKINNSGIANWYDWRSPSQSIISSVLLSFMQIWVYTKIQRLVVTYIWRPNTLFCWMAPSCPFFFKTSGIKLSLWLIHPSIHTGPLLACTNVPSLNTTIPSGVWYRKKESR